MTSLAIFEGIDRIEPFGGAEAVAREGVVGKIGELDRHRDHEHRCGGANQRPRRGEEPHRTVDTDQHAEDHDAQLTLNGTARFDEHGRERRSEEAGQQDGTPIRAAPARH